MHIQCQYRVTGLKTKHPPNIIIILDIQGAAKHHANICITSVMLQNMCWTIALSLHLLQRRTQQLIHASVCIKKRF